MFGTASPRASTSPLAHRHGSICISDGAEVFVAGARYDKVLEPFVVRAADIDKVQYGSDETKTHRKIKHIFGTKYRDQVGRLLVSELFTVGQGGWSGFPPHKHDEDRPPIETRHDETYNFRFRPKNGFGLQLLQREDGEVGEAYHLIDGSTLVTRQGLPPLRRRAGLRDVLFHHPGRPEPASADPVFPTEPTPIRSRRSPASRT